MCSGHPLGFLNTRSIAYPVSLVYSLRPLRYSSMSGVVIWSSVNVQCCCCDEGFAQIVGLVLAVTFAIPFQILDDLKLLGLGSALYDCVITNSFGTRQTKTALDHVPPLMNNWVCKGSRFSLLISHWGCQCTV